MNDRRAGHGQGHEPWEELASGYVLYALEPDEQQRFEAHLAGCSRCERLVADDQRITAELAYLSDPVEPPAELWDRIRSGAGIGADAPADTPTEAPTAVIELPRARRVTSHWWEQSKVLTAAAALIAIVIGVGAWQGVAQLGGNRTTSVQALVAGCEHDTSCQVVDLDQARNRQAMLLLRDGHAQLVSAGLAALPADSTYVLWQLPSNGAPIGVAAFRVGNTDRPLVSTALPLPLDQTTAFAVSREHGHTIPPKPSQVVAVGAATA